MTLVPNADRISSVLVNQAPRQPSKDVTLGVYFTEDRKEVGVANGGGRKLPGHRAPWLGRQPGCGAHAEIGEDNDDGEELGPMERAELTGDRAP